MVDSEEIRAALLGARGIAPYSVADHVVVARARVEADLFEVDQWVQRNRGRIDTLPGRKSRALGQGRWQRAPATEPSLWYVVPASALGL